MSSAKKKPGRGPGLSLARAREVSGRAKGTLIAQPDWANPVPQKKKPRRNGPHRGFQIEKTLAGSQPFDAIRSNVAPL